jgi:hypothetical protein
MPFAIKIIPEQNKTLKKELILSCFLMGGFLFNSFTPAVSDTAGVNITEKTNIQDKGRGNAPIIKTKENPGLEDRVIGSLFKTTAKVFISTVDIDTLKKQNIEKLNKMDTEKFRKQYTRVYGVIKELPFLETRYGITENTTKDEVIKEIQALNKKQIYEIIDVVPDTVIVSQFRQYLNGKKQKILESNVFIQVNQVWNKIIKKVK